MLIGFVISPVSCHLYTPSSCSFFAETFWIMSLCVQSVHAVHAKPFHSCFCYHLTKYVLFIKPFTHHLCFLSICIPGSSVTPHLTLSPSLSWTESHFGSNSGSVCL
ncbi:hypothetical protein ILYODFUR_012644 [Ilyodon furcidens]|uniref:Secreted protein n=1 Tax=Ilyodon furcidens TaxID=33524 RepID=A0ABV0TY76_9TELE